VPEVRRLKPTRAKNEKRREDFRRTPRPAFGYQRLGSVLFCRLTPIDCLIRRRDSDRIEGRFEDRIAAPLLRARRASRESLSTRRNSFSTSESFRPKFSLRISLPAIRRAARSSSWDLSRSELGPLA
jgi:hypothetical protein